MSVTYPTGLDAACPVCGRHILADQPYTKHPLSVSANGDTVEIVTCVYCPAP